MAGSEMVTQEVLIVLKIPKGGTKKDLKDIKVTVKTESGEEIPVLNLSEPNYTVVAEAVNNEPSSHEATRKASSAANIVKSPSWPTLKHAVRPMTAMNGIDSVTLPQDMLACDDDNDVTTTSCQSAEEQDALYFSVNHSSLHTKGNEAMDINGPFYEGLSRDNYSDYSTYEAEEGSNYLSTFVPINYYIPENPLPIMVEESPLVLQDGPNEIITVSAPTSSSGSSGPYAICHTEVAATSKMVVAADEEVTV